MQTAYWVNGIPYAELDKTRMLYTRMQSGMAKFKKEVLQPHPGHLGIKSRDIKLPVWSSNVAVPLSYAPSFLPAFPATQAHPLYHSTRFSFVFCDLYQFSPQRFPSCLM